MNFFKNIMLVLTIVNFIAISQIKTMEQPENEMADLAQHLEQAYVQQNKAEFQRIFTNITSEEFSCDEQINNLVQIATLVQNSDLITTLCQCIVTKAAEQEHSDTELYNTLLTIIQSLINHLIKIEHLEGLKALIVLYNNGTDTWQNVCEELRLHIKELINEQAQKGYPLEKKSDTSFYGYPNDNDNQNKELKSPPSLLALCKQRFMDAANNHDFDNQSLLHALDYAQMGQFPDIQKSCFGGLYLEAQESYAQGFDSTVKWLEDLNLNAEQKTAFVNYIVECSSFINNFLKQPFKEFKGHNGLLLALSCGGKVVASCSEGETLASFSLLNYEAGTCYKPFANAFVADGDPDKSYRSALSEDGKVAIVITCDSGIRLFDCETGNCFTHLIQRFSGELPYHAVVLSNDKKTAATGSMINNKVILLNFETRRNKILKGHTGNVVALSLSKDGKKVVSGSEDKTVRLWNCDTGECKQIFKGHTDEVHAVVLSEDEKTIISASYDQTIRTWDCETGTCIKTLIGNFPENGTAALSKNGKIFAVKYTPEEEEFIQYGEDFSSTFKDYQSTVCLYNLDFSELKNLDLEVLLWLDYILNSFNNQESAGGCYYKELFDQLPQEIKNYLMAMIKHKTDKK
jgi:hypothetical protein